MGRPVTLAAEPCVVLEPVAENPDASRARCVCGSEFTAPTADAAMWAEAHALRCPRFLTWAHERIDNLGYTLGYYIPAQVLDLLHQLLGQPAAASLVMPWLVGIEDRPEADG